MLSKLIRFFTSRLAAGGILSLKTKSDEEQFCGNIVGGGSDCDGRGQKGGSDGGLPVIDVVGSLGTYSRVPMSERIASLEYIPLETGPEFMIDRTSEIIVTDPRIFIDGYDRCCAFTRQGKFVSDVGRTGRGPGEYTWFSKISVDEENETVYLNSHYNILAYSWEGEFLRTIEKPTFGEGISMTHPGDVVFLRDNLFLGHISNQSGEEPYNWIFFDDTGRS